MVGKVVSKTGAMVQARVMLYKVVVKLVLLYMSDSWVVTGAVIKVLEEFHHQVARRIMGIMAHRTTGGEREWPLVAEALETSGLCPIKEYIKWRQDTVEAQVACWTIYELCTGSGWMPGTSKFMWWWEHDVGQDVDWPVGYFSL